MNEVLTEGYYNAGERPSDHVIGKESFKRHNGGAIPPNVIGADDASTLTNLLKGTNTHSAGKYQLFCRDQELPLHPARMPPELAGFFIRFLTEEDDLVIDPFAGSNTTGEVAERSRRRWLSIEAEWKYAITSIARFTPESIVRASQECRIVPR